MSSGGLYRIDHLFEICRPLRRRRKRAVQEAEVHWATSDGGRGASPAYGSFLAFLEGGLGRGKTDTPTDFTGNNEDG